MTTPTNTLPPSGLAKHLKEGTKKSHRMAENVKFIRLFLKGVIERESYRKLTANFYFIYETMEAELERLKNDPRVKAIYFPELWRQKSIEEDLLFFYGPGWKSQIHPSPAARNYVARIKEVAGSNPLLLIAHSYTRYLGDLSGGQILRNIASRALGLKDAGLAFYDFKKISDAKEFKNRYRASLNELPLELQDVLAVVEEANHTFRLNMAMFEELDGGSLKGLRRWLFPFLFFKQAEDVA